MSQVSDAYRDYERNKLQYHTEDPTFSRGSKPRLKYYNKKPFENTADPLLSERRWNRKKRKFTRIRRSVQ